MTTLTTRAGQALTATVYADRFLEGYIVVVEFADQGLFSSIDLTKTPTSAGREVVINLSSTEVDLIKNSRFRVRATKSGTTKTVATGVVNYTVAKPVVVTTENITSAVATPDVRAIYGRGLRPTGNLVSIIGTSLDANAYAGQTTFTPNEAPGWFNRLCHLSVGRIQKWGHLAVPGATTQQIHDLQLPQVLALNPRPHACIVGCGPNESASGPTTGWKALVTDICNQLRDAGIVPILKLEPPRGVQGAGNTADAVGTQRMNRWKQFYAAQQGIPTVDAYTPIAHITGGITTAYNSGDGVHLTEAGYLALATDVVTRQKLPDLFPNPGLVTVKDLQDSTDILDGSGLFNGGAPGWSVYGTTAAIALASGSAGENIAGSWLKVTRAGGSTGDSLLARFLDMTGKAPGDAITAAMRFKTTGFTALAGAATYQASLHWTTATGDVYQSLLDTTSRDTADGLSIIRTTVPAGATDLQLDFTIKGATTTQVELYLAEVVMRNRTTLGTAA